MIIFTEPIRHTSFFSFNIFQDSEDDTKEDIRAINYEYVIFGPYKSISNENIEELGEKLSKLIADQRYSDILKKKIILRVKSINTPSTPFQNEIKEDRGMHLSSILRHTVYEEYSSSNKTAKQI